MLALLVVAPRPAPAQEAATDATRAARLAWHRQRATKDALEFERSLAAAGTGRAADVSLDRLGNPRSLSEELQAALGDRKLDPRPALADLADKAHSRVIRAEGDWAAAFRNRAAFERHVEAEQARYGFDFARNAPPEFRVTLLDAAAVVWAALVFAVGLRLARHEDRVDTRRRRRGRLALAGAAAGLLVTGGCGGPAPAAAPWDVREADRLGRETREAAEQTAALRTAADADRAATVAGWAKVLGTRTPEARKWAEAFAAEETGTRETVRGVLTDARLAERLAAEAAAEREKLPADRARLAELVAASRVWAGVYTGGRVAAGVVLAGLAFAPLYKTRRRRRKWLAAEARKCPRCLALDRLTERRPDAVDARYQEAGSYQCGECGYRFRKSYARLPRLCFPTVGIRASGKTHMLVTAYDKVRNGNAPTAAAVQPAPSMGDDEFEALINLVLRDQASAGFTQHLLPNPIIVHARDADSAGESTVLVNLFDYSGEMVQKTLNEDLLRQRAVLMDGFMMFIDPTQLYGGRGGVRLEDQIKAMNDFYQDMREARGIEVGRPIPLPVAVCVTKFDLLVSDNPIRGLSVPYIHKLLAELNPPGPLSLDVIEGRSAVVEEMIPMMFPGFDLRKRFREFFGGQVMFFPMSSVSLAERELGEKDLRRRQFAPFGVVEPVLWLLHMHGYQVLGGTR